MSNIPADHAINGETFQQWATRTFEFENCEECGRDETGHDAAIVMGNWFARCKPTEGAEVLNSTIDTPEMQDRIAAAAKKALLIPEGPLQVQYEHGQWWITNADTGEQWSVVDASGPGSTDGFDFEKVTEGNAD